MNLENFEIGGWFYEPAEQFIYTITGGDRFNVKVVDSQNNELMWYDYSVKRWMEKKFIYYIPPTDKIENLQKAVLAIELKHER